MGRSIDQDVHAAFVEFRAKDEDKCLSVQCIYCQQIRAKNTSRQKEHLLNCPGLQNHPSAQRPTSSDDAGPSGYAPVPLVGPPLNGPTSSMNPTPNGLTNGYQHNNNSTPSHVPRPSIPAPSANSIGGSSTPSQPPQQTPVRTAKPTPAKSVSKGAIPAPPLDDVHAAFVEFKAKEEDKCMSVQCIYCQQIRAKNTSRQREHLAQCQTFLNVMKDSIPANQLLHRFDEGDIARSLTLPAPTLDLDFRMSIKLNPKVPVGQATYGQRNWISFIGGQWAGRWGKGIVIPGGQDSQLTLRDLSSRIDANFLIQTNDEPPALIVCKMQGWWTGAKDVMEKLHTASGAHPASTNGSANGDEESARAFADTTPASSYKYRVNLDLETGDERYAFLNTGMWLGTGIRRSAEIVVDAYRVS